MNQLGRFGGGNLFLVELLKAQIYLTGVVDLLHFHKQQQPSLSGAAGILCRMAADVFTF